MSIQDLVLILEEYTKSNRDEVFTLEWLTSELHIENLEMLSDALTILTEQNKLTRYDPEICSESRWIVTQ